MAGKGVSRVIAIFLLSDIVALLAHSTKGIHCALFMVIGIGCGGSHE
jgi:hypothetical protein